MSQRFIRDSRIHHGSSSSSSSSGGGGSGGNKSGGTSSAMPHFRAAVFEPQGPSVKTTTTAADMGGLKRLEQLGTATKQNTQPLLVPKTATSVFLAHPGGWTVPSLQLQRVSPFHDLDDYHRVFDKIQLESVLRRLEELFQITSVCAKYHDGCDLRTASATCTTLERVEFVVVVWVSRNDAQQCIVEVQKTKSGGGYAFYEHAQRVLDTVDGAERLLQLEPNDPLDVDLSEAEPEQQCLQTVFSRCVSVKMGSTDKDIQQSMEHVADMLTSGRYDGQTHGVESLQAMTDVRVSGFQLAKASAKVVLDSTTVISQQIVSLAACVASSQSTYKDLEFSALTILGQSMNLVEPQVLEQFIRSQPALVQSLLDGAVNANAHIAYLSTHMLSVLHAHLVHQRDAFAHLPLEHMQMVGATSHAALANASERLLHCMNNN